eukprot:COSAG02_NODE_73061_length_177_cov_35.038462_1_plen_20_part_01
MLIVKVVVVVLGGFYWNSMS